MARKSKKTPNFKVNKLREFVFKKQPYNIIWKNKHFKDGTYAECDNPETPKVNKEIRISPRALVNQKRLLESLIDESVHTHWFLIDNDDVGFFAQDLANFLWKIGYRLPTKPRNKID